MKKLLTLLALFLILGGVAVANQTTLMCGGKYIGYDDQFIYLNWERDKHKFKHKLFIKERDNGSLKVSLASSDTLTLYPNKKYISYWLYGKERLVYLCKDIKLK
jgi:hypothetical protein